MDDEEAIPLLREFEQILSETGFDHVVRQATTIAEESQSPPTPQIGEVSANANRSPARAVMSLRSRIGLLCDLLDGSLSADLNIRRHLDSFIREEFAVKTNVTPSSSLLQFSIPAEVEDRGEAARPLQYKINEAAETVETVRELLNSLVVELDISEVSQDLSRRFGS